jgi:hypothetical protein
MRGVKDPEIIQTWVDILERIYRLSGDHEDPRTICEMYSGGGSETFLRYVLGNNTDRVLAECGMSLGQSYESVRQGIRMAQRLCYCRDWSDFKPANVEPDPFGRKKVKVSNPAPTLNWEMATQEALYQELVNSTPPPTVTSVSGHSAWLSQFEPEENDF